MGLLYSNYESQNNSVTNNTTKINAVSGTLTKTYQKSYFIKENDIYDLFGESPFRKIKIERKKLPKPSYYRNYEDVTEYDSYITSSDGRDYDVYYKHIPIIILQIMLCGENKQIYEVIDKEDYDDMFKADLVEKVSDGE